MSKCKYCEQELPKDFHQKRSKTKGERVRASLAAAKANGVAIGRPKKRDDKAIIDLRSKGLTLNAICKKLNTSKGSVQAALRGAK